MTELEKPQYNPKGHSFSGYLGGKSQLAKRIVEIMPEHKCYAEVFGGAGWVLFKKTPSRVEVINDINTDLVTLYRVIKYHFDALVAEFEMLLVARDEFERLKRVPADTLTDIQRAARYYYLLRMAFGNKVVNPVFSHSPTRGQRLKLGDSLKQHLLEVHERLRHVTIDNLSYDIFIKRMDSPDTLFYLDPPYWEFEDYYGKNLFGQADFNRLASLLAGIKGRFILSINDVPEIREIFKDFNLHEEQVRWSVNGDASKMASELLICNF